MSELISAKDAAKRLGVSHMQITRLCQNGTLRHERIGNAYCIDPQSVEDARERKTAGRPRKWKHDSLLQELRKRGYEAIARKIEKIFNIR